VLCTWNRVLKIGGYVNIRVPSLLNLTNLFNRPENQTAERQDCPRRLCWPSAQRRTP
jgi:predicted SAM-dependent methyltransferase